MNYLFVLGNASELAEEELYSVLPAGDLSLATFAFLGGTVKVAEIFSGSVTDKLTEGKKPGERIIFGLSGDAATSRARQIKDELERWGYKVRFILPKKGENELSSVVVADQKVEEIYLIGDMKAKTIWVQDFADWNKRDYGRPEADPHIGMLPPKVARMMVNIGLPATSHQQPATIFDPFCGVGTILAEGLMVGADVLGSDANAKQVEKTKRNLEWVANEYQISTAKYQVFPADARAVSLRIRQKINAIVTEPFLGPAEPKALIRFYTDCLEDWKRLLSPGGRVVIALPSFAADSGLPIVQAVIDKAKVMGYSLQAGPYPYFRPQAKVRRNICIFTYGSY